MTKREIAVPAQPSPQRLFYEPVILEDALQQSCRMGRKVFNESQPVESGSLASPVQAFHSFVDNLAQVCDNARGGKTVTAFAILHSPDGPEFVFGSNERDDDELFNTKEFVENLLNLVGNNPLGLKPKPLTKQVLWRVLLFNLPRLGAYLNQLAKYLDECIEDCDRRQLPQDIKPELKKLKDKADFPRDFAPGGSQDKFLSDCEKLLKAILAIKSTPVDQAIRRNAKDDEIFFRESWCELRHYLGRLLSFRLAAQTIVSAAESFPNMFKDFKITSVPSSKPIPKPIPKSSSLTTAAIIRNMIPEEEERELYLEFAEDMKKLPTPPDQIIFRQVCKPSFRPRVHAEILVHNHLLSRELQHPREYWNSWKYIGSSKGPCRLCSYYFLAHPDRVQLRKSHMNLYPNWCLPGAFEDQDSGIPDANTMHLLQQITERVRDDAKRTLAERSVVGKNHDTSTSATFPGFFKQGYNDTIPLNDSGSQSQRVIITPQAGSRRHVASMDDDDGFSIIGEAEETGDDEDGGVSVISGYI